MNVRIYHRDLTQSGGHQGPFRQRMIKHINLIGKLETPARRFFLRADPRFFH
jgi:hypothetical protein